MRKRPFKQVDVFTDRPFYGNPVAVVLDAEGLDTAAMQRIARWTNLSETTFVLAATQPGADYRLRIFTPSSELPFAGHPTVGSAHAVLESGRVARKGALVQECGAGLIRLAVEDARIFATAPPAAFTALDPARSGELAAVLGAAPLANSTPTTVALGPTWLVAQLADAPAVAALAPDMGRMAAFTRSLGITGITVFGRFADGPEAINVRSFAPAEGVPEDPVCGSGNASVGYYIARHGVAGIGAHYDASQGREIGRDGRVSVRLVDGEVRIGGHAVTCVDGTVLA